MTDDINPQAVPTREQIAQAIHDSIQRETPNEYVGPCYDTADAVLALFAQPTQAVGDEVHSSLASRESDGEITALALDYLANKDAIQAAVGPHFAELAKRHAAYMAWEHRLAAEQVGDHYASFLAGWHACELTSQSEDIQ
jgi:hypothetical protein